jgi:hypothetical protein
METRQKRLLIALTLVSAAASLSAAGCGSDAPDPGADKDDGDDGTSDDSDNAGSGSSDKPDSGAPASGGSGGSGVDCKGDVAADSKDLITDFEDGTKGLNPNADWKGGFYVFNDKKTEDAEVQSLEIPEIDRCSDGSSAYALCTKGTGFIEWGAGIGTDLNSTADAKMPVDLSDYTGVSFWIMRRGGAAPKVGKVILADKNTAPEGGACKDGPPATEQCDPFVKNATITDKWTKVEIKFADLKQGAWGKSVPSGFSKDAVYGFQVQFDKMMDFDVCIDHVALTR